MTAEQQGLPNGEHGSQNSRKTAPQTQREHFNKRNNNGRDTRNPGNRSEGGRRKDWSKEREGGRYRHKNAKRAQSESKPAPETVKHSGDDHNRQRDAAVHEGQKRSGREHFEKRSQGAKGAVQREVAKQDRRKSGKVGAPDKNMSRHSNDQEKSGEVNRPRRKPQFTEVEIRANETEEDIRRDMARITRDIELDIEAIKSISLNI